MTTEKKFKRLANQSTGSQPPGAKPSVEGGLLGCCRSAVPVSSVARQWNITPRRVRVMLSEGRLEGRHLQNGYREVFFANRFWPERRQAEVQYGWLVLVYGLDQRTLNGQSNDYSSETRRGGERV